MPKTERNIVLVAHKFLPHPDDELVAHLNKLKYTNVLHINHSFNESPHRKSWYVWYKNGKEYKKEETQDYKSLPEPLLYLKELYFTLFWVLKSFKTWDTYIGMDGLLVLFGNTLRTFRKVNKTIYWAIDFVPKSRFSSELKNKIYHWLNTDGYKNADEMWDLSPRMAQARKDFLGVKETDYKSIKVVPYGMWVDRIKKYTYQKCDKNTLVFMGHIKENQGVQLVLDAIPAIVKEIPDFIFKIIGTGQYKEELEKNVKQTKIGKHVTFMGRIDDNKEVENEIAKSCAAIAPYMKKLDKWTYYADPGKVKTYLACGVPVLLTDLPWNTRQIVENKCGIVISEDPNEMSTDIIKLMKKNNDSYRKNAIQYAKNFDYNSLFTNLDL